MGGSAGTRAAAAARTGPRPLVGALVGPPGPRPGGNVIISCLDGLDHTSPQFLKFEEKDQFNIPDTLP